MAHREPQDTREEGHWGSPHQNFEPSEISATDGSPENHDGCGSPPPKNWAYDSPPPFPLPSHDAPEVVAQPYLYEQHYGRPFSPSTHDGTTVYSPPLQPAAFPYAGEKYPPTTEVQGVQRPVKNDRTYCGLSKRLFITLALLAFLIVLGLALGLGLGLGLKKDKESSHGAPIDLFCRDNPEYCIGGAFGEEFYSKKGAFNGSGIALAGESWNHETHRIFTLYFQHWTGDIRYMQYTDDQQWVGGTRSETVVTDAKNATAISAVAYALNGTQYVHIFYISRQNQVKQKTMSNETNIWTEGTLTKLNITVWDTPGTLGLQACWKGNFYGDSDAKRMPTASGNTNEVPFDPQAGMNIWIPTDESTFQQYAWYNGISDDWGKLDPWLSKNTHAGVGCYSWGPGTVTYAMMVNKMNDTEIWWKDTNKTAPSTDLHPIQSWRNSTKGLIPDVYPSTSLGFTTFFYAQMADRSIRGYNISYEAENTHLFDNDFTVTDPAGPVLGLGGTHLTVTGYEKMNGNVSMWSSLYVFYQTEGDDITAFTRPLRGGEWTNAKLKIPAD